MNETKEKIFGIKRSDLKKLMETHNFSEEQALNEYNDMIKNAFYVDGTPINGRIVIIE
jgi:hypothetical protein